MNILFYTTTIEGSLATISEEEARHLTTVLRRRVGDPVDLTDGKGRRFKAEIAELGKRHAIARILEEITVPAPNTKLHLAVAPTKNIDRFEWMLEKSVEIGVTTITPLLCRYSERNVVRQDRLEKVILSAMKQSMRSWLPELKPLTPYTKFIAQISENQRFIGWVPPEVEMPHLKKVLLPGKDTLILIGPEGDFSAEEVALAQQNDCIPVTLGEARLRTETAGIYACSIFNLANVG